MSEMKILIDAGSQPAHRRRRRSRGGVWIVYAALVASLGAVGGLYWHENRKQSEAAAAEKITDSMIENLQKRYPGMKEQEAAGLIMLVLRMSQKVDENPK